MTDAVTPAGDAASDEIVGADAAYRALVVRRAAAQLLVHGLRNDAVGVGEALTGLTVGTEVAPASATVVPLIGLVAEYVVEQEILIDRLTEAILSVTVQLEDMP
ncbi:hypothetical protein [Nocardia otitidiscaviarum]|uniref:hypothetical protein n=1 Tax=Nocardia otitidiscaviarum TaxID=1823 RepID=UPI002453C5B2|nr:hypothetical protein [Nocardia otitidiscaviarum]